MRPSGAQAPVLADKSAAEEYPPSSPVAMHTEAQASWTAAQPDPGRFVIIYQWCVLPFTLLPVNEMRQRRLPRSSTSRPHEELRMFHTPYNELFSWVFILTLSAASQLFCLWLQLGCLSWTSDQTSDNIWCSVWRWCSGCTRLRCCNAMQPHDAAAQAGERMG